MKKLLLALLLWSGLATAQIGNYPPLIGAKGTTDPTNCQIGQLFYNTTVPAVKVCNPANTWTAIGGGTVAFPVTVTGGTSGGIPYFSATTTMSSSALLGANQLVIGGGAGNPPVTSASFTAATNLVNGASGMKIGTTGTDAGLTFGYSATSGRAAIYVNSQTPGIQNGILFSNGSDTTVQAPAGNLTVTGSAGINFDVGLGSTRLMVLSSGLTVGTKLLFGVTAPTIASGFGSSPSVPTANGTAAFTVNVGTGGTASSGVLTMPAATTGWDCKVTPNGAPQAAAVTYSAPTSTTSVTITNYTLTTGSVLAWAASTVLNVSCHGY